MENTTQLQGTAKLPDRLKWNHPFDHFHVDGLTLTVTPIEEIIGKGKMSMKFLEGPIGAALMGAEFQLYSETEMSGFIITNIEGMMSLGHPGKCTLQMK